MDTTKMILPEVPFRVEFEITEVCNLHCKYCYVRMYNNDWVLDKNEAECMNPKFIPTIENLQYVFEKTKREVNPFEVVLLGGEPFTRNDIVNVLEMANKVFDRVVGISTNGTLLNKLLEEDLARLKELSRTEKISLQLSIDSTNPAINDITRGKTQEALKGLDILEKYEIPFCIGIVLTVHNKDDVEKTARELLTKYKMLKVMNLEPLQLTLALGEKGWKEMKLETQTMQDTLAKVQEVVVSLNRNNVSIVGVLPDCNISDTCKPLIEQYGFMTCSAGLLRAGIYVDGTVTPCLTMRHLSLGNLYKDSWKDMWKKSKERYLTMHAEKCIVEGTGQCNNFNKLLRKEDIVNAIVCKRMKS